MKKNKLLTLLAFLVMLSLYIVACDDEEISRPIHTKNSVQFELKSETVSENGSETTVTLIFSRTASENGTINLKVDASFAKYFTTSPSTQDGIIKLTVTKNDNSASFKLTPIDNTILDGNKIALFRIVETSDHFQAGLQNTFTLTIQDDESPAPVKESYANFVSGNTVTQENSGSRSTIQIHLSESVTVNGSVVIQAQSENAIYGDSYRTEPSFSNGRLELQVQPGTSVVSFNVIVLDNDFISGELDITFSISETTGNIKKGLQLSGNFKITDDELTGLPRGYETSGGGWGMRRTYEYNSKGNIARIVWQTYTPYLTTGVDTYYYDNSDNLIRINIGVNHDKKYYWENGKIVKQEIVLNGVVKSYIEYGYDVQGNVGVYRTFYLQPDGTYPLSDVTLLLYHVDNNLYKKIVYYKDTDQITSETTFDSYSDAENPFPIVEVLPNLKAQNKLPNTYHLKSNGQDLLYRLAYEFGPDRKVIKRTASLSGSTADVAVYHYY